MEDFPRQGHLVFGWELHTGAKKSQRGLFRMGVLRARHAPHAPTPFAQVVSHDTTALSTT
jgi:hypothetical protein